MMVSGQTTGCFFSAVSLLLCLSLPSSIGPTYLVVETTSKANQTLTNETRQVARIA